MRIHPTCLLLILAWSACPAFLAAQVALPDVFGDGAVLQRERPVPVWGTAAPGEAVTVAFAGQRVATTAGADGRWSVLLASLPASAEPHDLQVNGLVRHGILVGEVWICCGQSNMEMPVGDGYRTNVYPGVAGFAQEIAAARFPAIHLFRPDHQTALVPRSTLPPTAWQECSPATVGRFSAVGYFFARHLHQSLQVPIGMIQLAKSSTTAEAWTIPDGLRTLPAWARILGQRAQRREPAAGAKPPLHQPLPAEGVAGADNPIPATVAVPFSEPACLFNGMVAPLVPFALRGVVFYQGESNAKDAPGYRTLFPALITSWRTAWGQGDLPFLFVQLANYGAKPKTANETGTWAHLREAQAHALALPRTGMAVAIDIGSTSLIHPANKQEVGRRLGLLAQSIAYGQRVACRGPTFAGLRSDGDTVRVRFTNTAGGLVATPIRQGHPAVETTRLCGFTLAGADQIHHWAEATIVGDEVVLRSPQVPRPVTARYAFAGNPDANLGNQAGLPAEPFRSDADLPLAPAP